MSEQQIIESFFDCVCDGGTPVADCDLCGKTWFDSTGEYMEEGELDALLKKYDKQPDKYAMTNGYVSYGHAFGRQFVWECRCEKAVQMANAIWNHRFLILRFIKDVQNRTWEEATQLEKSLSELKPL